MVDRQDSVNLINLHSSLAVFAPGHDRTSEREESQPVRADSSDAVGGRRFALSQLSDTGLSAFSSGLMDPVLADLVEQITQGFQAGEPEDIAALAARYPEYAERIVQLAPALQNLASFGLNTAGAHGTAGGAGDSSVEIGRRLGDFLLVRELGRGGMAIVFEAVQQSVGRRVALKILPAASVVDSRAMLRFQIEARAAACLQHPHIVPVYAVDLVDDTPYYAMQLIEGKSLAELIVDLRRLVNAGSLGAKDGADIAVVDPVLHGLLSDWSAKSPDGVASGTHVSRGDRATAGPSSAGAWKKKAWPGTSEVVRSNRSLPYIRSAARLGVQAALALEYAHGQGILHRDIKPANLLIDHHGCLWVADFGLARLPADSGLTRTGELVGTIRYMSPEQADGKKAMVDRRTDIYSLGATLYELLALQPAYDGRTASAILRNIADTEPPPLRALNPAVPSDLATVVAKAMAKEASSRYLTAQELADDLNRFLDGRPVAARPTPLWVQAVKRARRRPIMTALTVLVQILAISLVGLGIWSYRLISAEARLAVGLARLESGARVTSQGTAAALAIDRGIALADSHQVSRGLFWMLRGLESTPTELADLRRVAAANLALWGRQAPMPRSILPSDKPISTIALSPDGQIVAVGLDTGVLTLWDADTGQQLDTAQVGSERISSIEFHPGGRLLATTSGTEGSRFWDVRPLRPRGQPMTQATRVVARMGFDPTGRFFVTAGLDGVILFRDPQSGLPVGPRLDTIDTSESSLLGARFRPGGNQIVTYRRDGIAQLWDVATGRQLFRLPVHEGAITDARFRPDGRRLATIEDGGSRGRLRVWDSDSGRLIAQSQQVAGGLMHLAFHPDGQTIATHGRNAVARLFDAETCEARGVPMAHGGYVYQLAFSHDGRLLATSSMDGSVWFFDAATGNPLGATPDHGGGVPGIAFRPDGRGLVTASRDGSARVWDITPIADPGRYIALASQARTAELSPDGKLLATDGRDGAARLFEVATGQAALPPLVHTTGMVRIARFSPDGRLLVTGGDDSVVRLWDVKTGLAVGPQLLQRSWAVNAHFSPDGSTLLVGHAGGSAALWDLKSFRQIGPLLEHPVMPGHEIWHVAFDPSGRIAVTGSVLSSGSEATVAFWDARTGRPLAPCARFAESIRQMIVGPEPGGPLYVVEGGRLHGLDLHTFREIGLPLGQRIECIAISPGAKTLLAGGTDKTARLLNVATGNRAGPILEHEETVRGVAISPDGRMLLTLAGERIRFWDAVTGKLIGPPREHRGLATRYGIEDRMPVFFTPDGRTAVSVGGSVVLWDVPALPQNAVTDLGNLASSIRALTGTDVNDRGDYRMLNAADWQHLLVERGSGNKDTSPTDLAEWHDRLAAESVLTGNSFTTRWHLDRLVADRPMDWTAFARRSQARRLSGDTGGADADAARARTLGAAGPVLAWEAQLDFANATDAIAHDRWAEARTHLHRLVERTGDNPAVLYRLADVDIRLERWDDAEVELAAAVATQGDAVFDSWVNMNYQMWLATLRLQNGHTEAYRAQSRKLLDLAAARLTPRAVYAAVWHAALGPDATDNPMAAVNLAESALHAAKGPMRSMILAASGAALYRAGRFVDAIARLEEADRDLDGDRSPIAAFLAMAHQARGCRAAARRSLDRLETRTPCPPNDWGAPFAELEVKNLLREAKAVVLDDPAFPADPFDR
jgi:WD40 repeat protein/serine/threonine protein kinase/tetratricopeptide (TPR) repeat protein